MTDLTRPAKARHEIEGRWEGNRKKQLEILQPSERRAMTDWIRISPKIVALTQLQRAAEHKVLAEHESQRLLDVVRCLHLALLAAMTEALSGSDDTGALNPKSAVRTREAFGTGGAPFEERVMDYSSLLKRVQAQGGLPWAAPVSLSEEMADALGALDEYRKGIDHPKPTSWSIARRDVETVVAMAAPFALHMMSAVPHHYEPSDFALATDAVGSLSALA